VFQCTKSVFLAVNASLRWLNNDVDVYLVGQRDLGHFRRKTTNAAPTTLSVIQAASQSTFINALVISRNDKNKQLTLLSQRKLALTARNTLFAL
jgi:hypothetical protein